MSLAKDVNSMSFSGSTSSSAAKIRTEKVVAQPKGPPMKAAGPGGSTFSQPQHQGYSSAAKQEQKPVQHSGRFAMETEAAKARRAETARPAVEGKVPLKVATGGRSGDPAGRVPQTDEYREWQARWEKRLRDKGIAPPPKPEVVQKVQHHDDSRPAWHGTSRTPDILKPQLGSSARELREKEPKDPAQTFERLAGPSGQTKSSRKAAEEVERERLERSQRTVSPTRPAPAPQPTQPQRTMPVDRILQPGQNPWERLSGAKTASAMKREEATLEESCRREDKRERH